MSEPRKYTTNGYRTDVHRLNDLNLSSFWWHGGTEWTSIVKDEITHNTDETLNEASSKTHKPIVYSVFAILILLGGAILTRTGEIYRTVQSQNQLVQQIIYVYKK
jgi:hypothetical protein